jgi:methylmalonyl-CoA/ethylmalonyl-CoA epimerase
MNELRGIPRNLPLHHVGIVQPTERHAMDLMALLGLEEDYRGFVPTWAALCIFTKRLGSAPIEFVVPDGGPLVKFNKGLGGLHHVAFEVQSLDDLTRRLAEAGMKLIEPERVKGAGQFFCNFLSPVYTRGITIEFVELIRET